MRIAVDETDKRIIRRGERVPYNWLTCTGEAYIGTLLRLCPEVVLDRYLVVTALDSGVRRLTGEERDAGWQTTGDLAYSPRITSIESLQFQRDGPESPGYDEWYVFDTSRELGQRFDGNPFEFQPTPGQVLVFVKTLAFMLHDSSPGIQTLLELFWKQMEWIQPESYIADGCECLMFVSRNKELVDKVNQLLASEGAR